MATNSGDLQQSWLSFVRTNQHDAMEELVQEYPNRRSLYVDVIDLHDEAPELAKALFSNPDRVLYRAGSALSDTHESLDRVNVRLENHPGLLRLANVRSRHVGELVTIEGVVDDAGPPEAKAVRPAFECQSCGTKVGRRSSGFDLNGPSSCQECGSNGPFRFLPGSSTYEDIQRITLRESADTFVEDEDATRFDVYLTDDIVGTIEPNASVQATGIVRLLQDGSKNRFSYYLDANSVTDEPGPTPEDEAVTDELQQVIESRWRGAMEE